MAKNIYHSGKIEYLLDFPEKYRLVEKAMVILLVLLIIWFVQMVMMK